MSLHEFAYTGFIILANKLISEKTSTSVTFSSTLPELNDIADFNKSDKQFLKVSTIFPENFVNHFLMNVESSKDFEYKN